MVGNGSVSDLMLPALTLGLGAGASLGRVVFERIRADMSEDHIRLAIAKGVPPARVLSGHIAPRIVGPLATAWANTFGALLGGVVIVESIFGWPGLGQLILQAIAQRDFPVIQAYLVFMGLVFFSMSILADIVVFSSDPQLRRSLSND
ncbi:MAG: ABC transporter permease [Roseobacter sp.]